MPIKDKVLNEHYWNDFYKRHFKHTPCQFCVSVLTEIDPHTTVVEFGSGNGRDAIYFASQGHKTVAMDLSPEAIASCERELARRQVAHAFFLRGDVTNKQHVDDMMAVARSKETHGKMIFYSRFVMHTLDDNQEDRFLNIVSTAMLPDERLYLEFRSKEDAKLSKHYGNHFRRYIDTDLFQKKLTQNHPFSVDYTITGQGMAKFKQEDPVVSRIIARKR